MKRRSAKIEPLESRRLLASIAPIILGADNELNFANYLPAKHNLWNPSGYLTKASNAAPLQIATNFISQHYADLGLTSADVQSPIVTDQYTDSLSGMTHIYLRQQYNGLAVINADMTVNITGDGRILSVNGGFVSGAISTSQIPTLTPLKALRNAANQLSLNGATSVRQLGAALGASKLTRFASNALSLDAIPTQLQYVPTAHGLELAWNMILRTPDGEHWYDVSVSDGGGLINFANDWVEHASYNVIPRPTESPVDGPTVPNRTILTNPADLIASPYGWHDTNGVAGAEFTDTRGNNVSAQEDTDNNNTGGFRPDGGPSLNFDFPINLAQAPSTYQSASISNLFYWNNVLHDIHYKYGFTELAGNFQVNNYGHGGTGNDAVQADAQDGGGINNANFATPPDGQTPRMQMYLFNYTTPGRDGSLDSQIMIHEYGHGVSNRLTGGPANSNALSALQSNGMGEGWSDFWAMMFTMKPTDGQFDAYPMASYAVGSSNGIRRYAYSYSLQTDPLTIDAYGTTGQANGVYRSTEVHNTGELWATTLLDMAWLLINKYGYDSDIANGYNSSDPKGNTLALQLVMDGLKLQPANPSFKDARDAILQADQNLTGGANQTLIWQAFARRGMGVSFVNSSSTGTSVTAAYDAPMADPVINLVTPINKILAAATSATFTFNQSMDQSSFDLASDLVSFTGPGNVDLRSTISGFQWLAPNQLKLDFVTSKPGTYTMTLGPNIFATDDGHAMDQNVNGIAGEAADVFTFSFTYTNSTGPDGFGYKSAAYPVENIDLQIGQPGVVTLLNGVNDTAASINLGTNTFNFYGTSYTGTQIGTNPNGLITFATNTTASTNTDLTTSPSQASIAVLWDDWKTTVNAPGATDSAVLYKLQDTTGDLIPDRLIVEWSDVPHQTQANGAVTFQAILQLNTGTAPGRIILNYRDVTTSASNISLGASSTVGIKASSTQGSNRLLVSYNSTHPWIKDGTAIVIDTDISPPGISSEAFTYLTAQQYVLTFSESLAQTPTISQLILTNTTTNQVIDPQTISTNYDSSTRTLTFTATSVLPDGNYTAQFSSTGLTDAAGNPLDADGNGIAGGTESFQFFVLAADANHDRTVNTTDLLIASTNYLQSPRDFSQGDFNYDNVVNLTDLQILAARWGTTLEPPPLSLQSPSLSEIVTSAATPPPDLSKFSVVTLAPPTDTPRARTRSTLKITDGILTGSDATVII